MVKVGDKVKRIASLKRWEDAPEILVVKGKDGEWISVEGHPMNGLSTFNYTKDWYYTFASFFEEITQTEAERRGAKFGVMGVVKSTGEKCAYVNDTPIKPSHWDIVIEGQFGLFSFEPSEICLDHEPEFVAWSEAPEHLRYDASRVYCDGEPVKWIAKPEYSVFDVVATVCDGSMEFSGKHLMVKL